MATRWGVSILLLLQLANASAAEKLRQGFERRQDLGSKFLQLSPVGQNLWNQILADEDLADEPIGFDGITGRMLTLTDPLRDRDFVNVTGLINRCVIPDVGRVDLMQIVESSRRALDILQFDYVVESLRFDPDRFDKRSPEERPTHVTASFASHGPKVYLKETLTRGSALLREQSHAFDGEVLRESVKYPNHEVANSGVSRLTSRISFFPPTHPLRRAMLIDSKRDLAASQPSPDDLIGRVVAGIVFPGFSDVDGQRCVVISNFRDILYCAPALGYAVVQSKIGALRFDQSTGRLTRSRDFLLVSNSDFQQLSSGVYLPRRMEYQRYLEDGELGEHTITTVKDYSTNSPPDELFVKVIPEGAVVSDGIQHAVYTAGNDQSLQSRLKQASPRRGSQSRYRNLVAVNLFALLCLAAMFYVAKKVRAVK